MATGNNRVKNKAKKDAPILLNLSFTGVEFSMKDARRLFLECVDSTWPLYKTTKATSKAVVADMDAQYAKWSELINAGVDVRNGIPEELVREFVTVLFGGGTLKGEQLMGVAWLLEDFNMDELTELFTERAPALREVAARAIAHFQPVLDNIEAEQKAEEEEQRKYEAERAARYERERIESAKRNTEAYAKALRDLGYTVVPPADGVATTIPKAGFKVAAKQTVNRKRSPTKTSARG